MVLAVVAMIVGAVTSAPTSVSQFQRVSVSDGSGTITFKNTGDYVAYYESASTAELGDQPEKITAKSR